VDGQLFDPAHRDETVATLSGSQTET